MRLLGHSSTSYLTLLASLYITLPSRTRARGNLPRYTGLHSSWAQISLAVCTGPRSFWGFPRSQEGDETEPAHTVPPYRRFFDSRIRGSPDAGRIWRKRWVVLICPTCEDDTTAIHELWRLPRWGVNVCRFQIISDVGLTRTLFTCLI